MSEPNNTNPQVSASGSQPVPPANSTGNYAAAAAPQMAAPGTHSFSIYSLSTEYLPAERTTFWRACKVELRKLFNTRLSRWLMIIGFILSLANAALNTFAYAIESSIYPVLFNRYSFQGILVSAVDLVVFFLILVSILSITQEWSTRSALQTFTSEPKRLRVLGAKLTVSFGFAFVMALVLAPFTALCIMCADILQPLGIDWEISLSCIGILVLKVALTILFGYAFALVTKSTVFSMLIFILLPSILDFIAGIVASIYLLYTNKVTLDMTQEEQVIEAMKGDVVTDIFMFISPTLAINNLVSIETMHATTATAMHWLGLLVSQLIWVAMPFTFGALRWRRTEVK